MADKRIYELTEASTVGSSDVLALDSQNMAATKKVKVKTITDPLSNKNDISSLILTGSTNTTGGTIEAGRYFYLDGDLVIAKTNIAAGATFTPGTNYVLATVGGELTDVKQTLSQIFDGKKLDAVSDLNTPLSNLGETAFAINKYTDGTPNAPNNGVGSVMTWTSSANYGAQLVLTHAGLYYRSNKNATPSAWLDLTTVLEDTFSGNENMSAGAKRLRKCGHTVFLGWTAKANTVISSGTVLLTLPSGYRPDYSFDIVALNATQNSTVQLSVATNGNVSITNDTLNVNQYISFSTTFFVP